MKAEDRFWMYVDKKSENECWEWLGGKLIAGYGLFRLLDKMILAHRFSWEIHNGEIPNNLFVLHHCDNTSCINPKHLFLGNNQDNANDKVFKNRQSKGKRNPLTKLCPDEVSEIRNLYVPRKMTQDKLAKMFGVSRGAISHVLLHDTWKYIGE